MYPSWDDYAEDEWVQCEHTTVCIVVDLATQREHVQCQDCGGTM